MKCEMAQSSTQHPLLAQLEAEVGALAEAQRAFVRQVNDE
jgi:hypothetical protein